MQPFRIHTGIAVPLDRANIDTDQIIPKQFLKSIERTGFGKHLFFDWRYLADGAPNPAFVLNERRYAGASILVTGKNFGCGSSREHAPWALADYGFRAILGPSFADIFRNNCVKNGLLTVILPEQAVDHFKQRAAEMNHYHITVDLERRLVFDGEGFSAAFPIDEFARRCLLEGLDEIGLTLEHEAAIAKYEARHTG